VVDEIMLAPLHAYVEVLPPGFADNNTVPPIHIHPLLLGAAVGVGLTVTVVVPVTEQPGAGAVTVKV